MNESFWTLVLDPGVKNIHFIGKDLIELTYYDGNVGGAERESQSSDWKLFHKAEKCLI